MSKDTKSLVFRVRKQYFERIVAGDKTIEYRRDSPFWRKRLEKIEKVPDREWLREEWMPQNLIGVFICGKRVCRKRIIYIERIHTPESFSEQGKHDVDTPTCLAFHLGQESTVKSRDRTTYVYDRRENCFFFVSDVGKHKITQAVIIANGVRDLCITKDMRVQKTSEVKPTDICLGFLGHAETCGDTP